MKNLEYVTCPICNKKFKTLVQHVVWNHNMKFEDFKKQYPDAQLQINRETPTEVKFICKICGRGFTKNNCLALHMKKMHFEEYEKQKNVLPKFDKTLKCQLCGFETNNLYFHVVCTHQEISWEDYCKQYNHNPELKAFFSEKHKEVLSTNKTKFYNSERGMEERKRLSKKISGTNNPACDPNVREKISISAINRMKSEDCGFAKNSYGIRIIFYYVGVRYSVRSYEEFKCILTLLEHNKSFEYEKVIMNYEIANSLKHYILDFKIGDLFVEIKSGSKKQIKEISMEEKYFQINEILKNSGSQLLILSYSDLCDKLNMQKNSDFYFYNRIKELLFKNECTINYSLYKHKPNSRILSAIDVNYLNNPNIQIHWRTKDENKR